MRPRAMLVAALAGASMVFRLGSALAAPDPGPLVVSGDGITYFDGRVRSPLAGVGTRGDQASNRLVLDVEGMSTVMIDRTRHRITIVDAHLYTTNQTITDLTLLGTAKGQDGARVPLAVHLTVQKNGANISTDLHRHWTVPGTLTAAELEPFDVAYNDGKTDKVIVTSDQLLRVATDTATGYTISGNPIEVQDNLAGHPPSLKPGAAFADVSVGVATKGTKTMLVRAELRSLDAGNTALAGQSLAALLERGAWQLRVTFLSRLLPKETLRRELYLLGLDELPSIAGGLAAGLKKGDPLTFTFRGGKGRLAWGHLHDDLTSPLDSARSFFEFNLLGAMLSRRAAQVSAAVAAASRPAKTH